MRECRIPLSVSLRVSGEYTTFAAAAARTRVERNIMPLRVWGDWQNEEKTGHDIEYYRQRDTQLDCRGDLRISPQAHVAHEVHIITAGHAGDLGRAFLRAV